MLTVICASYRHYLRSNYSIDKQVFLVSKKRNLECRLVYILLTVNFWAIHADDINSWFADLRTRNILDLNRM